MTREEAIEQLEGLRLSEACLSDQEDDDPACGVNGLNVVALNLAIDALKVEPAQETEDGAGLIGQVASPTAGTEPRLNREAILSAVDAEEELNGSMPMMMVQAAHADIEGFARATVRATKRGIRSRLEKLIGPVPAAPSIASHDGLGLNIDMLDVDRLQDWARLIADDGGHNITRWGSTTFVVSKLKDIANRMAQEIKDVGVLRRQVGSVPDSSSAKQAVERAGAQREDHSNTLATSSLSEAIPVGQQNKDDARLAPASASRLESDQRDDQTPSPQPEKGWEDVDGENADYVNRITAVVREADRVFENVGGGSRHWVRDVFLPLLNRSGLYIATEETCQHCGEDIRKDNDGDWLDRETHTTCDTPEGRKHTPQFGSATKATQAEPAASTGRSEAQKSQPHSDAERSSPAGLNLMERDAVLKEVETRIRIAERQGWTNRSVPIRLLKQIAALLPSSGSQE